MAGFTTALAIGAGVGLGGGLLQGEQEKQIAGFNARQAQREGAARLAESKQEADRLEQQARRFRGAQTAAVGGAGVTLSGSALDVIADDALQLELARQDVLRAGRVAKSQAELEADITKARGKAARSTALLSGATSGVQLFNLLR